MSQRAALRSLIDMMAYLGAALLDAALLDAALTPRAI